MNWLDKSHREFFWMLLKREFKVRYAGSTLGGLWNLIHPLVLIAIYMTIFSSIMRMKLGQSIDATTVDYGSLSYGVHLCAGMIPWLLFSDVLIRSTTVLIDNGNFLKKVAFPPLALFLAILANALIIHFAGFLAFLGILLLSGFAVPLSALLCFPLMIQIALVGMGGGLILAALHVFFRDTAQIVGIALQFLFWFNPIVYVRELMFPTQPQADLDPMRRIGGWIVDLNPLERFISASQQATGVIAGSQTAFDLVIILFLPAVSILFGLLFFRRTLPEIRDCL